MSYFNHAYKKTFVLDKDKALITAAGTAANALTSGQFSVQNPVTNDSMVCVGGAITANTPIMFAMGSYFGSDTVGNNPAFGGYQETYKSKVINPRYVSMVASNLATAEAQCVYELEVTWGNCFPCGTLGEVRIDIKGSPALRFLNHNMYRHVSSNNMCCKTAMNGFQDPALVLANIANRINGNATVASAIGLPVDAAPWISDFVTATVQKDTGAGYGAVNLNTYGTAGNPAATAEPAVPANYKAKLILTAKTIAALSTSFADCSFDPRDMFETEPIKIISSVIDDSGEVCTTCGTGTQTAAGAMATGHGESVLRDLILTDRYRQFPMKVGNRDFARMREIEQTDDLLSAVNRTAVNYNNYYLVHSVPRFNNPSGTFDHDQYSLKLSVIDGSTADGDIDPGTAAVPVGNSLMTRLAAWADSVNGVTYLNLFDSTVL